MDKSLLAFLLTLLIVTFVCTMVAIVKEKKSSNRSSVGFKVADEEF